MQGLHWNLRRFLNSQQYGITLSTSQLTRKTLTDERILILGRYDTSDAIKLPEPFINAINFDAACATLAWFMNDNAFERDHRAGNLLLEIRSELFSEETCGRD